MFDPDWDEDCKSCSFLADYNQPVAASPSFSVVMACCEKVNAVVIHHVDEAMLMVDPA